MNLLLLVAGKLTGNVGLYVAAGLLALGLSAFGVQTWRLHSAETDAATARSRYAEQEALLSARALEAEQREREKEKDWAKRQQEITDATNQKLAAAAAAASAADASASSLRDRVATLARAGRRACGDTSIASRGAAAPDAIGVLADVLGRADARAGLLASVADQRGVRGEACERAYESLRK